MPQSGNTKRKKRNQKKQQLSSTSVVDESNASTSNSEKNQKDESGEGVSDRKVLDEFDDVPQDEQKSSDVRKKKKKKKRKKRKESNSDVSDNPSTCKKSDSSDSCDESTAENAEQRDTSEENKKLGHEGIEESPVTNDEVSEILSVHEDSPVEDVNNNTNISSEAVVSDSSNEITESSEPLNELKEKNERKTNEETCIADDDTSKILSVVCEDTSLKDYEEDIHVNDELSCATDLSVETHSSMTYSHCEDITLEVNETHETPPDTVEIPAEGLSLEFISSDDERPDNGAERNFDCIARLLIGVGAHCLRQYFKSIHPNWSNLPTDASALKKGVLRLQSHENKKFYSGNTEEWDVSLLIRVLRFSAVSSVELKNHPDIDDAVCEIQDVRNKVFAHAKDKKISDSDFKFYWNQIKANLLTIGAEEEEINSTLTDNTALSNEQYRQLLLEELYLRKFSEQCDTMERKDETLAVNPPVELSTPSWDAFMKFRDHVNSFKSSQTHYILLTESMTQADLQNFKVLSAISWKMVLDFNPSSEDNGIYKAFSSQNSLKRMLTPFTPGEIKKVGFSSLPKQIDSKRTQWLFVNGRKEDTDDSKPKSFPDWHQQSVKHISTFFSCCSQSEKFDNQKSITCLLLPISKFSAPFVELTLQRLEENFSEFDLNFVCIDDSYKKMSGFKQPQEFPLSSMELKNGIKTIFNVSEDQEKYKMPSFHEDVHIPLSMREYVFMNESLELFYIGCEQEAIDFDKEEEEREKDEEEHRMSFLSGNRISTGSLYFNHDAKRVIEREIEIHIQRLVGQTLTHSDIVRITHSPGTGGSTIARRVLWNLHKSFPCASVKLPSQSEYDEDSNFISGLCDRISLLENKCGIPPVVLLDGHRHWKIQGLSNKIVRTLNSRGKNAVILECQHGSKPEGSLATHQNAHVHKVFYVNARLEDTESDLKEFKSKFQESNRSARRVFHFPMLSMMEEFRDKLDAIVSDTLDELDDLEKDIAAFVAFLQIYAEQSTPALLLYEVFKSRLEISEGSQVTYDTIKNCFTGTLLNLMVYESKRKIEGESFARYTLQHHAVATLVFDKYQEAKRQSFYKFVYEFLDYSVSSIEKFRSLYCHLFLFNRGGNRKHRFSLLIEKLKSSNPKEAAIIFSKAAERIPDPRVYGHAARFYAKMTQPNFKKAEDLIAAGLKLSESKGKAKSIQDSKGVVLSIELKHKIHAKKVKSIQKLEELANRAITAFKLARDVPPSFYSPLIGEVEVWLSCIEWIVSNQCSGDTEETIKFLTVQAPPFFRTCIGDCFRLLDMVDDILMSSTSLSDPDESRDHAQRVRISLVTTTKPKRSLGKGPRREIDDLYLSFVSNKNLPLATQKEVKRSKARSFLSLYRREQQRFSPEDLLDLVKLLEEMVLVEKDCSFARHFLQLCPQITGRRCYSLEQSWKVCCEWLHEPDSYDCMRFYYGMVISFMQILNGCGPSGFFAQYKTMVQKLKEASYGHCRRNISLHFLGKNGDGMSKLISYASLLTGEITYRPDDSEAVKSFWTVESRRKLKEYAGRVRVKVQGNREVTTIELLEGDIELHVGKIASVDIGKPGIDFDKDAKVYFVVSFNLAGPIANGITFYPVKASTEAVH